MAKESKKPITEEIATTAKDIDIFAGWLLRLENPDPTLRTEAKGKGLKLYDEVDRDPHANSVLQDRYLAVVGKDWEIVPAKSAKKAGRPAATPQEERIADFVKETLTACNFDQARQELLQGVLYGFYVSEIMWEYSGGAIRIKKFIGKHPRRFSFALDRSLRLLTPNNMIEGEEIPDRKFICYTYGDSDNPYGKGLGQKLWWSVWFKKNGIKFWLTFLDKFGMPTGVGKYPAGTLEEKQKELLAAIDLIHSETGVVIPEGMTIDLLEAARRGDASYEKMCDYMDRQISKAVLSQTLTTEVGDKGSFAASKTHGDVKQEIVEADADLNDACLNDTLIKWIVDYNFPGITDYPKLKTHAEPKPNLDQRSQIDERLVKSGVPIGKKYFYETYGIPEPAEDEEVVTPSAGGGGMPSAFAEVLSKTEKVVDAYADRGEADIAPVLDDMINDVKKLVNEGKSLKQIAEELPSLYSKVNEKKIGELMTRAFVAAELAGRYEVNEEK